MRKGLGKINRALHNVSMSRVTHKANALPYMHTRAVFGRT